MSGQYHSFLGLISTLRSLCIMLKDTLPQWVNQMCDLSIPWQNEQYAYWKRIFKITMLFSITYKIQWTVRLE